MFANSLLTSSTSGNHNSKENNWLLAFANFHGINTLIEDNFKLWTWHHCAEVGKDTSCQLSSCLTSQFQTHVTHYCIKLEETFNKSTFHTWTILCKPKVHFFSYCILFMATRLHSYAETEISDWPGFLHTGQSNKSDHEQLWLQSKECLLQRTGILPGWGGRILQGNVIITMRQGSKMTWVYNWRHLSLFSDKCKNYTNKQMYPGEHAS